MIEFLIEPFEPAFMQRALIGGLIAVVATSLVGTWVVLRGLAFLGDALAHGVIPGIALAVLWGFSDMLATVVQCHHDPQKAGPHEVASSVVFLADGISKKLGLHWNVGEVEDKLLLPKCLGLGAEEVKKIATTLKEEKDQIIESWGNVVAA